MYKHGIIMKKCSAALALLLGGSLVLSGCGSNAAVQNETSAVLVNMQKAQIGSLTLQNSFVGTVSPYESVYVIPFASGTVTEVNYSVGDKVNAGDVLFRIDDEGAKLQLSQAELSVQNTKQQAQMALGSQAEATDLQLEGSQVQAQSGYEQAQIAYYKVKDAYDEVEDAVDKLEENIDNLKKAIAAASTVSGNDASVIELQTQLAAANAALESLKPQKETLEDSLRQAESAYRAAETGKDVADRSKELTQGEIRSDTKKQLDTGLALAQVGLESAKLALSYYTVTAPISGVITGRNVEVNGIAASSNPAFTIANDNSMTVTFNVSESVKKNLSVGDEVIVERSGQNYTGHITEVGVAVNMQTGLFQVKANVEANGSELPSGVSVKITADTYRQNDAVVIPYDAVYYDNEGSYVYLNVNGRAAKTYVTVGIFDDTNITVTDGISAGDEVITSWSARLLDGVQVEASNVVSE